jgi:hypothetical protein
MRILVFCRYLVHERDAEPEYGALADSAFDLNRAPVYIGDPLCYRKSETGAALRSRTRPISPPEPVKDMRQVFWRHPDSGIGHAYHGIGSLCRDRNGNTSPWIRILDCIIDENKHSPAHRLNICTDR